jgi:hypothetical protein
MSIHAMKRIFFIFLMACPFLISAQAIRFNYFGASYFEVTSKKNYYYGFGYEQNIGSGIAVSLEYNRGYGFDDEYANLSLDYTENGDIYKVNYSLQMPWTEFSYQSKYFFTGADDNSFYISSGIGLRSVKYDIHSVDATINGNYAYGLFPDGIETKKITLIPVSVRLGYRGSIDYWFGDYAIGLSYIPGASSKETGFSTIDNHSTKANFRNFSFTFSCAFGIGWAD